MEAEPKLDEKYKNGVWYDATGGAFCQIREVDDTIGLFRPDSDPSSTQPYYTYDEDYDHSEDALSAITSDMTHRVSEEAVENPAVIAKRAVRMVARNDPNELMSIPRQEAIDIRYARRQVTIFE